MGRQNIKNIRQAELIEATISAIHTHGFADLTVNQIAELAETSTGSIHYYFGGKDALLEATMRHLLGLLKDATLRRLRGKTDPRQRLMATIGGNFDETLFTVENCRVWSQFWGYAPYQPRLARLQRLNKSRVRSNLRAELKKLLSDRPAETVRVAIQSYMDGVWVQTAQTGIIAPAAEVEAEAIEFLEMLLP